jgi:hypothetical protein
LGEAIAPPPQTCVVDLVRAEWPELFPLFYVGHYEATVAADPIGNDIGVKQINNDRPNPSSAKPIKHDNGVRPLVIGNDYGGGGSSVIPINNDNGVSKVIGILAWPKMINNYNGGGANPAGSSSWPKPNQLNNDNGVTKGTYVWPKPKPIVKVIGTSAWPKPINNEHVVVKGTSVWPKPKPINNDNIVAKGTTVWPKTKHDNGVAKGKSVWLKPKPNNNDNCGGARSFGTSANRINNYNAKPTPAKQYDSGGGGSAKRINNDNDKGANPTSANHYGGGGGSANRINNDIDGAKPTSSQQLDNGGGADSSHVAGDGMADLTDVDACLPFWVMKTDIVKLLPLPHPPRARPHGRTDKSKRPESHPTKECARARVRCL